MRRALRRRVLGILLTTVLGGLIVATAGASPSASYADPAGDANEAPDISSVTVDDAIPGAVTVRVEIANFEKLPSDSRIILEAAPERGETADIADAPMAAPVGRRHPERRDGTRVRANAWSSASAR